MIRQEKERQKKEEKEEIPHFLIYEKENIRFWDGLVHSECLLSKI
jgi:hypothetical protein